LDAENHFAKDGFDVEMYLGKANVRALLLEYWEILS